jgi:uncharacterized protein (DUF3820 family)
MLKDIYQRDFVKDPIRDRNWVMPFGKHKGTPLHEIINHDPDYIEWLANNTDLDFHSDIMNDLIPPDYRPEY